MLLDTSILVLGIHFRIALKEMMFPKNYKYIKYIRNVKHLYNIYVSRVVLFENTICISRSETQLIKFTTNKTVH